MIGKIAPCKGCTMRSVGCHDRCKGYLDWKAENDIALEKKREDNHIIGTLRKSAEQRCKSRSENNGLNRYRAAKRKNKKGAT